MKHSDPEEKSSASNPAGARAANLEAMVATIHQIGWLAHRDRIATIGQHGLSLTHYLALELLSAPEPCFGPRPDIGHDADYMLSMRALADGVGAAPSTITALVDTLVEKGYALRSSSPADRRVVRVGITSAGIAVVQRLRDRMLEDQRDSMASVSDDDVEVVGRVFDKLLEWYRADRSDTDETAR